MISYFETLHQVLLTHPELVAQIKAGNYKAVNSLVGKVMSQNKNFDPAAISDSIYEQLQLKKPVKEVTVKVEAVEYTVGYENVGAFYKNSEGKHCRETDVELYFKIKCRPFEPGLAEKITATGQQELLKLLRTINLQLVEL